jgi:type IV secretory pathway VirB10-like protein
MTTRQQGQQHSSPREGRGASERGQAMPSVVAVVSVIAIVVALVAFFAGDSEDQATQQASSAEPTTRPTADASNAPDADVATEMDEEADGAETAARTPQQEKPDRAKGGERDKQQQQKKRPRNRPQPQTGPPDVYVEVYNNTTISGLAAATAAELQDAGWQVVGVDNWHGDIPASTVYYPAGLESEAQQLAETLGFGRVRGAVAPMKFDRLTVILTPDAA